jgi:hypothetical protein
MDLFRPRLIVSSKVFQVAFILSVLFLPPCCCSFLFHVVANLICIFLVPRQLVLLSILTQNFSISFWAKSVCCTTSSIKYSMLLCQSMQSAKSVAKSRVEVFFLQDIDIFLFNITPRPKVGPNSCRCTFFRT